MPCPNAHQIFRTGHYLHYLLVRHPGHLQALAPQELCRGEREGGRRHFMGHFHPLVRVISRVANRDKVNAQQFGCETGEVRATG